MLKMAVSSGDSMAFSSSSSFSKSVELLDGIFLQALIPRPNCVICFYMSKAVPLFDSIMLAMLCSGLFRLVTSSGW